MDNLDKWQFCMDRECYCCGRVIEDEDVKKEEVVTGCPYCHSSFVD